MMLKMGRRNRGRNREGKVGWQGTEEGGEMEEEEEEAVLAVGGRWDV